MHFFDLDACMYMSIYVFGSKYMYAFQCMHFFDACMPYMQLSKDYFYTDGLRTDFNGVYK